MNLSEMARPVSNLTANAVEKLDKISDESLLVRKILYGSDNIEVEVSRQVLSKTALQTEMSAIDTAIVNYKDVKWIAAQIEQYKSRKSNLQIKLDLLDQ